MWLEILIVLLLTVTNGGLAMSELAIVSARPARLRVLADEGSKGAVIALRLQENPGRFLSTVQIGITLVGILSGAVSGATLGIRLSGFLAGQGLHPGLADTLGVGLVVAAITYLSLILGELVPKQIALRAPEAVAAKVAPLMQGLARVTTPIVWFLDISGKTVLKLLGQSGAGEGAMTDEEVKITLTEATEAGVLTRDERQMIAGVMRVADRPARALMTPRREVDLLDLSQPLEALFTQARASRRSRLPVRDGDEDEIIGVIACRDLLGLDPDQASPADLRAITREAPAVMDAADAGVVLQELRRAPGNMLLVFDEYGHFEGIITPMDVLEAIVGSLDEDEDDEPAMAERDDGSFLVAGWMQADEFFDRLGLRRPEGDFDTMAGFVLERLRRIPALGESFVHAGWRVEVIDLDGMRIDKLLVARLPAAGESSEATAPLAALPAPDRSAPEAPEPAAPEKEGDKIRAPLPGQPENAPATASRAGRGGAA